MDTSIHYWKEKFAVAASLVIFSFLVIVKLFNFISNSTFLFDSVFSYVFLVIFIPGVIIGLAIFICILVYHIFIRSIWLFDVEENNVLGKRANNAYLFSFNVLSRVLLFFALFSVVNIVLFIIFGGELSPDNLIYFVSLLMTSLLFVSLPSISRNALLIIIVNLVLAAGAQFIGGVANQLDLKIRTVSENIEAEVAVKGITNTLRENTIPIYLSRMDRLYQKAEREFASRNYLAAVDLFQQELGVESNFLVTVCSDRLFTWVSKVLGDKVSSNILFVKDGLAEPNIKYSAPANRNKFSEYSLMPLIIDERLKIDICENTRGVYFQVFRRDELLDILRAYINKKIGDCFLLLVDYASAKASYVRALEKNKYYVEARNNLGYIYMKENNFTRAECEYKNILDVYPDHFLARINLGNIYLNNRQTGQSMSILRSIDLKSNLPPRIKLFYYQTLAEVLCEKGEFDNAWNVYSKALKVDPLYYPASMGLAKIYWQKGKFVDAKNTYENILKKQDVALAYIGIAKYYVQQKDKNKAVEYFNKAINAGNDYEAMRDGFIGIGSIFFEDGNLTEAENYFNKATNIDPYYYLSYQKLGEIYFGAKKWEGAKSNFLKAIEMSPQNKEVQKYLEETYKSIKNFEHVCKLDDIDGKAQASLELGWIFYKHGNYVLAQDRFLQAISFKESVPEAHYGLGVVYEARKLYEKACMEFREAIQLKPDYLQASNAYKRVMVIASQSKSTRTDEKEFFIPLLSEGISLYSIGEFEEAKEKFVKAGAINDSYIVHEYLGKICYKNKQYDDAIRELEKSLEMNPNQPGIRNALIRMQSGYTVFKELN